MPDICRRFMAKDRLTSNTLLSRHVDFGLLTGMIAGLCPVEAAKLASSSAASDQLSFLLTNMTADGKQRMPPAAAALTMWWAPHHSHMQAGEALCDALIVLGTIC